MGTYQIRQAVEQELAQILRIYALAREFMIQNGNPNQWKDGYPAAELLTEDIKKGNLYAVTENGTVRGVFCFVIGPDPTYSYIEDGTWRSDTSYGTIHRIASDGSGGLFAACLEFCRSRIDHIRIDTHHDNHVMQHIVEKNGFSRRGIIYVADGSPRTAYDLI